MTSEVGAVRVPIRDRLGTIDGLRVFAYPVGSASPPAAMVGYPELQYDSTKGRGIDRGVFPVTVLVGKADDRSASDSMDALLTGTGIKAALEPNLAGAVETVRVMSARAEVVTLGAVDYLGALFDVEVYD